MKKYRNNPGTAKEAKKKHTTPFMLLVPKPGLFAIATRGIEISISETLDPISFSGDEKWRNLEAGQAVLVVEVPDPAGNNPYLNPNHRKNTQGYCMKILQDELAYYVPKHYMTSFVFSGVSDKLKNKNFCITGDLQYVRETYVSMIKLNGGDYKNAITTGVDYLITNSPNRNTTKLRKARQLGLTIIDENQFFKLLP